jgi:hypothetical protein
MESHEEEKLRQIVREADRVCRWSLYIMAFLILLNSCSSK